MKKLAFVLVCLLLFSESIFAVDPGLSWKTIENEHLYVHYAKGNKAFAERAMAIAEAAHERLTKELNWNPVQKTHVVLSDETDQPNGYATPIFFNRTVLFMAPPTSIDTLEDFDDWFSTLIFHEYTHIVHLDKSDGSPEYLRKYFGRFVFLFPNLFQPSWVTEGLATHKETYPDRGIGRGQSTMFASMMREEVANGLQPISHVNLPVSTWPAGTTQYLYGVYFMTFLTDVYGEEKLQQWVEEYSNNLIPFFINTAANQALGKNLTPLWEEYQQWLVDRFQPQIDAINKKGVKAGTQISADAYRTDSVRVIARDDGDDIYYVRNGGYKRASLIHIDVEGQTNELLDLNGSADLDLHPESGLLLTQSEFCNNYTIYKDIYLYNEDSQNLTRLTECERYLFASWHPDGKRLVAVHHEAGEMALHLLDIDLLQQEVLQQDVLWQGHDNEIIAQVDVSPDGKQLVASVWRKADGWNIELFDIATKHWRKITTGVSIEANPQFTENGNVLFTMEVAGVYNLHRYYSASERVVQITNLIGGAFQSSQAVEGGPIYYTGYSAQGYAIYKLEESSAFALAAPFTDDKLELIHYETGNHQQRDYSALSTMYPRWWFPVFGFTDQRAEFGLTTSATDALGIHQYAITASYDVKLDAPAGSFIYAYADRFSVSGQRFNEITVDDNGDVSRLSDRSVAQAVLAFPNYYLQRQYNLLFAAVYDNTEDSDLAAGTVPLDGLADHLLGVAGLYDSANLNPLSISENDGMNLRLVAEDSDSLNSDFSGQVYTLDWRQYIRTGRESVFALRFVQGWGSDNPNPFKLGGEGISDSALAAVSGGGGQAAVFDVRDYALRGYKEGRQELRGRRMQLLSGEWRFPIRRIEQGVMTPPVGIMQWFGNVFAEVGNAYQDSPETYYPSAGIELTADINVFYGVTLRTRVGYAHGFDSKIGDDRLYLKVGGSF